MVLKTQPFSNLGMGEELGSSAGKLEAFKRYASKELQEEFLPRLATGPWKRTRRGDLEGPYPHFLSS